MSSPTTAGGPASAPTGSPTQDTPSPSAPSTTPTNSPTPTPTTTPSATPTDEDSVDSRSSRAAAASSRASAALSSASAAASTRISVVETRSTVGSGASASVVVITRTQTQTSTPAGAAAAASSAAAAARGDKGRGGLSGTGKTVAIAVPSAVGGVLVIVGLLLLLRWFKRRKAGERAANDIRWPQVAASPNEAKSLYPEPTHAGTGHGIGPDGEEVADGRGSPSMTMTSGYGSSHGQGNTTGYGCMSALGHAGYGTSEVSDYGDHYGGNVNRGYTHQTPQAYGVQDQSRYGAGMPHVPAVVRTGSPFAEADISSRPSHDHLTAKAGPAGVQPDSPPSSQPSSGGSGVGHGNDPMDHYTRYAAGDVSPDAGPREIQYTPYSQGPHEDRQYKLSVLNPDV